MDLCKRVSVFKRSGKDDSTEKILLKPAKLNESLNASQQQLIPVSQLLEHTPLDGVVLVVKKLCYLNRRCFETISDN